MAQAEPTHSTSPSRRSILRGAIATPLAAAMTLPMPSPDVALFALESRIKRAMEAHEAAIDAMDHAESAMIAWRKHNPPPGHHTGAGYEEMQDWRRRKQAAERNCRYRELEDAQSAACDREAEVLRELGEMPARTLDGLRFKARYADRLVDVARFIVADLQAMGA